MLCWISKSFRPAVTTWAAIPFPRQARLPAFATMAHTNNKVVIKSLPNEPNLTISLHIAGRQRNLERPKDELLEKPLSRIQKAAAPKPDKKQLKKQNNGTSSSSSQQQQQPLSDSSLFVGLHEGPTAEHPLVDPESTTNASAWVSGRLLRLGDLAYTVELNPPSVHSIEVHGAPFVGIPLVPKVAMHFANDAHYQWHKRSSTPKSHWHSISGATHKIYTPISSDQGCMLRVECFPLRQGGFQGEPQFSSEIGPVRVAPNPSSGYKRHDYTMQPTTSPTVRVVSYNVLADQYASTDTAKDVLFAQCPNECLEPTYRRPLVLHELLGYNADVICLQEVDENAFTLHLQPCLAEAGYVGVFTNKAGQVREGSAAFWKRQRFTLTAKKDVSLKSLFPTTAGALDTKYAEVFDPMLSTSPALVHALQRVATIAQLLLLTPVISPDKNSKDLAGLERPICLANTHLFFHYAAPHIRTMHVWSILQEAQQFIQEQQSQPTFMFCGDFNSDLNDGIPGAIELLSNGKVNEDHWDWAFGVDFSWGKGEDGENETAADGSTDSVLESTVNDNDAGELSKMIHTEVEGRHPSPPRSEAEVVHGVALENPFRLCSADGLQSDFTNYVKGYQGLLDYIWYEPSVLDVTQWVPLPSKEQLGGYLPSPTYPSDHLAIIADLTFKSSSEINTNHKSGKLSSSSIGGANGGDNTGDNNTNNNKPSADNTYPAALYNVGLAASHLQSGGVIAVPTDTIYGIAASADNPTGVAAIYHAKRRSERKPLAVCVADLEDVARYGNVAHLPKELLSDLLPGPVTLLLEKLANAPLAAELNPETGLIGIRIPEHQFLRAVCRQHKGALALTSANVSGEQSTLDVTEFEDLWSSCAAVFDGGRLQSRAGSTIVDLTVPGQFRIARRGSGFGETMQTLEHKYKLKHIL